MKKADRCGAKLVLIMGEDELTLGQIQIKPLQGQSEQRSISFRSSFSACRGTYSINTTSSIKEFLVVAEMKTEEEQVEALKRWWQENGKSLILTIAVSVGGVLSWNAYQDHQTNESELASVYFQQLMTSAPAGQLGETEIAEIRYNSDLLKKEFSASTYAQFAALMIARVEVQEGNLAAATTELEWVIAQQGDVEVRTLATLRLAKLLGAQNQYDEALALLVDADDAWQLGRLETRGDLLVAQGDLDAARAAYTEASLLAVTSGTNNPLLGLKLDNLAQ